MHGDGARRPSPFPCAATGGAREMPDVAPAWMGRHVARSDAGCMAILDWSIVSYCEQVRPVNVAMSIPVALGCPPGASSCKPLRHAV